MSEYTDYFVARAESASELRARLSQAEIPCLIVDDTLANDDQSMASGGAPWWAVLAADLTDVPPPRGRASRVEQSDSLAPLVTIESPLMYRRNIARELCDVVPALLHVTATEGATEWSLQLWLRSAAEPVELIADWESEAAVRGVISDAVLVPFEAALNVSIEDLRAHVTPGLGTAAAFAKLARLPWLPVTMRHNVPPASWLITNGTAVLTSSLEL